MLFSVYDKATGEILFRGAAEDITIQAQNGQGVVKGHYDPEAFVVRRNRARRRNTRQRAERVLARIWQDVRIKRQSLLRQHIDAVNPVRWASMSDIERAEMQAYRKALLDIPQTYFNPAKVVWPTPPNGAVTGGSNGR